MPPVPPSDAPAPPPLAAPDQAAADLRRLLLGCEPFGESDVFGRVQRAAGLEPLGLLSFATIGIGSLIAALDADFASVGTPAQTHLLAHPDLGYVLEDARFGLRVAIGSAPAAGTAEQVYAPACRRLAFLADKLREALRTGEKLFLHAAAAAGPPERLLHLHRALRRHGPGTLLAVQPADDPAQAGQVGWLAPGVMLGWLPAQTTLAAWAALCRSAEALARTAAERGARTGRGFFGGDQLAVTEDFEAFCRASNGAGPDMRFVHTDTLHARPPAGDLVQGETWFGPGRPCHDWIAPDARVHMARVESTSLKDAAIFNRYITVFTPERGVYAPSATGFSPPGLAQADPWFAVEADGGIAVPLLGSIPYQDVIGIPICGVGFNNYGHFLLDGLPLAAHLVGQMQQQDACMVGPPLAPWQAAVLQALGVRDRYLVLTEPRRFRRVIASSMLQGHVGGPTRFARLVFDRIRLHFGLPEGRVDRRIFIRRPDRPGRRFMENGAEVEACFRRADFEIVQPELLDFAAQVRLFATASVVAGEYGAAMANVGFCDPGTKVLEIVPETCFDNWTRGMCLVFAQQWHVYFARVDVPATGPDRDDFRYRVDVTALNEAIRKICRT